MGQHAEGLCQPPLREGIGRIALVVDGESRFKAWILQIGIEFGDLFSQHHALVDDRAAGQGTNIHALNAGSDGGFLDPTADDIELALKGFLIHTFNVGNQDLLDLGTGCVGLFTKAGNIDRHMSPAVYIVTHPQDFGFNDGPARFLRAKIRARQKHLTHRHQLIGFRLVSGPTDLIIEEGNGDLHMDARTVAGLAIGVHCPTMPDRLECVDPILHNPAGRLAVDRHDKTHAARRMLFFLGIETVFSHPLALGFFGDSPAFIIFGHGFNLSFCAGSGVQPCRKSICCGLGDAKPIRHSAATARAPVFRYSRTACAVSRPSRMAQTTRLAPRTMSPTA